MAVTEDIRQDGTAPEPQVPEDEAAAAVARALAHPARVRIVRLLLERRNCIGCEIVDEIGLAQSTVSQHLRILKEAGVVTGRIERPRICYSLNTDKLTPLAHLLNGLFGADEASGGICCPEGAAENTQQQPLNQES